ncbi:uncharacterized protein ACLA_075940 [Aspergillus clavatus NRRL 1]|uniref:Integral membrane protein n=1 Tax=Aspergillus clavatus (strain ATCC 1007 / CBS 513.65 / DSM 816 / NCTC 3887 / NRRL 1 / QM 1276 / 107) TaxID=344612 RepID=A1C833_ASPCL|nr:uncharacterized protein ACLA_075940 [Aspergillus clavatus NRRL 1]EAW14554.1 conserved hypothetical protein [Aspergillus clavatus NRRL 1]
MLEPRRLRHSSGWSGGSLWNEDITLSVDGVYESRSYYIAQLVFEFLTFAALLCFFVGTFAIRQPRALPQWLPKQALVTSIVIYILLSWEMLLIPQMFFHLCEVTVKRSYVVMSLLQTAFWMIGFWLLFYVFYRIIQAYLDRIANGGKRFHPVLIVHWILLGGLGIVLIANWGMYVTMIVKQNSLYSRLSREFYMRYNQVSEARIILSWIMSLEVLAWTMFIIAKSRFSSKSGSNALALGSFFLFVQSLESMIVTIMYSMEYHSPPLYLNLASAVVSFICIVGIYSGILFCCTQWCKACQFYSQEPAQGAYQTQPPMPSYQPYPPPGTQPPTNSGYSSPVGGHGQFSAAGFHNGRDAATNSFAPVHPHHQHA